MLANPTNCETIILENDGYGKFQLKGRYVQCDKDCASSDCDGNGNTIFYSKLRCLPKHARHVRKTRLFYSSDDES